MPPSPRTKSTVPPAEKAALTRFQRVTDFTQELDFFWRGRRCRRLRLPLQFVDLANEHEKHERHDDEVQQRVDEKAVVQRDSAGFLRGLQRRTTVIALEREEEVGKIDAAEEQSDRRHQDILDQRVDDSG